MNASTRPPRRRKSALAGEHPAFPTTVPEQQPQPQQATAEQTDAAPQAEPASLEDARTRARGAGAEYEPRPRAGRGDEARARKLARDAAYGWASAMRKTDKRLGEWVAEMERARAAGSLPGVLREYIVEAADRVGLDPSEVPAEVWHAAGLGRS